MAYSTLSASTHQFADSRRHNASSNDLSWATLACVGAVFFGFLAFLLPTFMPGRWGFISALLMSVCVEAALWFGIIKIDTRCFSLKVAFVASMIGRVFPFGMCFSVGLSEDYLFPWGEYLFESPLAAVFGSLLRSLAIALIFVVSRGVSRPKPYDVPLKKMLGVTSDRYELFLILAGCIKLTYWISITGLDNPLFYFARILNTTVAFVPFFVGYSALRFKRATLFWLGILALEVFIAFLTGSRGAAFPPIMYFTIGFIFGLRDWSARMRWAVLLAPVGAILLAAAVFIGAVRDVVGRVDLKTALTEGTVISSISDSTVSRDIDMGGGIAYKGFKRMTGWASYVIPTMTPDPIPYRGFNDVLYEIRASAGLGIFALINPQWRGEYYFANIYLNPYGFPVHIDPRTGLRTSNAPFPVQMDGFTRGGWIAAFGYILIACTAVFIVERLLRSKLLPKYQPLFLTMLTFLAYIATQRFGSISLVHSLRQLIFEGVLFFLLFFVVDRTLKKMGNTEKIPKSF